MLGEVLGRRPINPRYRKSLRRYVVEIRSQTLYELLKKPVDFEPISKTPISIWVVLFGVFF
jgi:hypothetical protein